MIQVVNREIMLSEADRQIGVVGDNGVKTLQFEIPKIQGEVDLSDYSAWVLVERMESLGSTSYSSATTKSVNGDKIVISWLVSNSETRDYGYIYISIKFATTDESPSVWQTEKAMVKIAKGINGETSSEALEPNVFDQQVSLLQSMIDDFETPVASEISLSDTGGQFELDNVEAALKETKTKVDLQESSIASINSRDNIYSKIGIPDPQPTITMLNGAVNGNFSDATVNGSSRGGWARTSSGVSLDITNRILTVTGGADSIAPGAYRSDVSPFTVSAGDVLYFRAKAKAVHSGATSIQVNVRRNNKYAEFYLKTSPTADTWYEKSGLVTMPADGSTGTIYVYLVTTWSGSANTKQTQYDYVMVINLSTAFGGTANIPAGLTAEMVDTWLTNKLGDNAYYFPTEAVANPSVFNRIGENIGKVLTETDEGLNWEPIGDIFTLPDDAITTEKIADEAVTIGKTDYLVVGKNIFDKTLVRANKILGTTTGAYVTASGYYASEAIPILPNTQYALNNVRMYAQYNSADVFVTGTWANTNDNTATTIITTDASAAYLRVVVYGDYLDTAQVEEGSAATDYEPYGVLFSKQGFTPEQLDFIKDEIVPAEKGDVRVTKSGDALTLTGTIGTDSVRVDCDLSASNNGAFNWTLAKVGGYTIAANTDDITPPRVGLVAVGANHGYMAKFTVTMANHNKTADDLGSVYSDDAAKMFTLIKIAGDVLTFITPYSVADGIVTTGSTLPSATLVYVSGGGASKNTGNVSISTISALAQLKPSVNNISVTVFLDGTELTEDGTYYGTELVIRENYTIQCYKEMVDYARANAGVTAHDSIPGVVRMANTYTYTKGLRCLINSGLLALKKHTSLSYGVVQNGLVGITGYTTKKFMPNVKVKSGHDFAAGVNMASYSSDLDFTASDNVDAEIPPSHTIDWIYTAGGVRKYGFALGYIVDKSNTKNDTRLASCSTLWNIRSTDKSYPLATGQTTYEAGDYGNFIAFRNLTTDAEAGAATAVIKVKDKAATYLYIDYNSAADYATVPLDECVGQSITVLQSKNFTLLNDIVDANGLLFNITDTTGSAVLKIV